MPRSRDAGLRCAPMSSWAFSSASRALLAASSASWGRAYPAPFRRRKLLPQVAQPHLYALHAAVYIGKGIINTEQVAPGIRAQFGPVGHFPFKVRMKSLPKFSTDRNMVKPR